MKRLRGKSGFTLVEAMVSIALLAILLLAFTLMVSTSSRMNTASQRRQEQFERVLSAVYLEAAEGVETVETTDTAVITVNGEESSRTVNTVRSAEGDVTLSWFE